MNGARALVVLLSGRGPGLDDGRAHLLASVSQLEWASALDRSPHACCKLRRSEQYKLGRTDRLGVSVAVLGNVGEYELCLRLWNLPGGSDIRGKRKSLLNSKQVSPHLPGIQGHRPGGHASVGNCDTEGWE